MKMTIAGDIRRIRRNILKPNGNGMLVADYGELHKVFAAIETKEREYKSLVKEMADIVDGPLCHQDCSKCPPDTRCASKRLRALVAKAREVVK